MTLNTMRFFISMLLLLDYGVEILAIFSELDVVSFGNFIWVEIM